jgi:hypothetical protein
MLNDVRIRPALMAFLGRIMGFRHLVGRLRQQVFENRFRTQRSKADSKGMVDDFDVERHETRMWTVLAFRYGTLFRNETVGALDVANGTDSQWQKIEPLLPRPRKRARGGRPLMAHRRVLEGILWILRRESRWQDLPSEFPSRQRAGSGCRAGKSRASGERSWQS